MKHLTASVIAAAGTAVLLSSCAAGPTPSPDSGGATGTVTVWAQGAEAESLPILLEDFEAEYPDINVDVTAVPWGSAHDKYQSAIAAGTTPDIGQMGTTWMGEFGGAGAFETVPADLELSEFYSGALDSTIVGGETVGVPWYVDTPVLYYRADLAEQAGFTEPPTTWDELKELATALVSEAGATYGVALAPHDFQGFLPFVWSNGASLTNDSGSEWTLDTPEMIEALEFYQSFFTEGLANPSPSSDAGAYIQSFVDGSVPMFFGGPFEVKNIDAAGGDGFSDKYATAVWPTQESSTSFVGGSDLVVFNDGKNHPAAWKVIEYLSRADVQAEWYELTGDLPSVQAAWDYPDLARDKKLAVFGQQLESVQSPPATTSWAAVQGVGNTVMEKLTVSGLDPAEAAAELQAAADEIGTGS